MTAWLIWGLCLSTALMFVSSLAARDFARLNRESLDGWRSALDLCDEQRALTLRALNGWAEANAGWRSAADQLDRLQAPAHEARP